MWRPVLEDPKSYGQVTGDTLGLTERLLQEIYHQCLSTVVLKWKPGFTESF